MKFQHNNHQTEGTHIHHSILKKRTKYFLQGSNAGCARVILNNVTQL